MAEAPEQPDTVTKPQPPYLKLLFDRETHPDVKKSLVPDHLNKGTHNLRRRLFVFEPKSKMQYDPICVGRGQHGESDDERKIKVDTTASSMSSEQVEFKIEVKHKQIVSLQLKNVGKNPISIKQQGKDKRPLCKGEWVTLGEDDLIFLQDEHDTVFRVSRDLSISENTISQVFFAVCLEETSRNIRGGSSVHCSTHGIDASM